MPKHDNNDPRPPPPSWLDKEFIQTALQKGENDPSITVTSCEFSMATAVGDGHLSYMYRAVAVLLGGNERRFVIKCHPEGGNKEQLATKMDVFFTETKMFTETLPAIQRLLEAIGETQPLGAKCLHHGKDPVDFLVLEDLRASGFTLANRARGLDMPHCKLIIKSYARLHASSLALLEQTPNALEYCKNSWFRDELREDITPFYDSSLKSVEEVVLKWPGYERFAKKIQTVRQNLYDRIMDITRCKEGKFNTLIHGDTGIHNFMFKYCGDTLEDVRLVDFQGCYYTSPTLDLQSFLTTCPQEEVRSSTDLLLKEYHSTLLNFLDKLQCSTRKITFEEFQKDFEEHSFFGFVSACCMLPMFLGDAEDLLTVEDITIQHLGNSAGVRVYERIMKKLLVKYEELGVL